MGVIAGHGRIAVNNLVGTCECIISSSRGNLFVKTGNNDEGITLTASVINNTGVISDPNSTLFYYLWEKGGDTDWVTGNDEQGLNTIHLSNNDLSVSGSNKNLVFTCKIYTKQMVYNELTEQMEEINYSQAAPLTYGEINLETTLKYWMEFNDTEGLKIYKEGSNIYTLTNNEGYFIIQKENNTQKILGSFTPYGTIFSSCQIGNISVKQTDSGGWVWTDAPVAIIDIPSDIDLNDGDLIEPADENEIIDVNPGDPEPGTGEDDGGDTIEPADENEPIEVYPGNTEPEEP